MHHAPTSSNPYIPKEELEETEKKIRSARLAAGISCRVRRLVQRRVTDVDKLLVDGQPIEMPPYCDMIFAVMDTALKGGTKMMVLAWCISLMSPRIRTSQN